jgi:trehalose 6-phosphate synthase
VPKRGGGGLVTALSGALSRAGSLWIASAMTPEDRERGQVERGDPDGNGTGTSLRFLPIDENTYERYYNGIANNVLWFVHHYLWDMVRVPLFNERTRADWRAYRRVNEAFAAALADESIGSPAFLVQDYHLSLVPALLRRRVPSARIAHFSHVPFAGPTYIGILPTWMREELLAGLLGADIVGFQASNWADNFLLACRTLPGTKVNLRHRLVLWEGREIKVRVYPVSIDAPALEEAARSPEVERARTRLKRSLAGSKLILRVDRAELSKNILRGFLAFEQLLQRRPDWIGRVRFMAHMDPSRGSILEYRRYTRQCLYAAERINRTWGQPDWKPIDIQMEDDQPGLLAAYRLYDVLLVNPLFDGMNLVAKEGPVLNRRRGALVLSKNAGAHDELGRYALSVNPFDVSETVEALEAALLMGGEERRRRARGLRAAILRNPPEAWMLDQLGDLDLIGSKTG